MENGNFKLSPFGLPSEFPLCRLLLSLSSLGDGLSGSPGWASASVDLPLRESAYLVLPVTSPLGDRGVCAVVLASVDNLRILFGGKSPIFQSLMLSYDALGSRMLPHV